MIHFIVKDKRGTIVRWGTYPKGQEQHIAKPEDGETYEVLRAPYQPPPMQAAPLTYVEQRYAAYPSVGDQLDALFKAGAFPPEMAERITAVKMKFPKS